MNRIIIFIGLLVFLGVCQQAYAKIPPPSRAAWELQQEESAAIPYEELEKFDQIFGKLDGSYAVFEARVKSMMRPPMGPMGIPANFMRIEFEDIRPIRGKEPKTTVYRYPHTDRALKFGKRQKVVVGLEISRSGEKVIAIMVPATDVLPRKTTVQL